MWNTAFTIVSCMFSKCFIPGHHILQEVCVCFFFKVTFYLEILEMYKPKDSKDSHGNPRTKKKKKKEKV